MLSGPHRPHRRRRPHERDLNLSAREIGQRRRTPAIGDVRHVDAHFDLEQLAGDMRRRPVARRRHAELARIGLGICDKLGKGFRRKRGVDAQDDRFLDKHRDRRAVTDEIQAIVQRSADDACRGERQEQRVAVRGRAQDHLGRDDAARAGAILDDDGLAKSLGQPIADQPREDVGCAARRSADDDANRPVRIAFRAGDSADTPAARWRPPPDGGRPTGKCHGEPRLPDVSWVGRRARSTRCWTVTGEAG